MRYGWLVFLGWLLGAVLTVEAVDPYNLNQESYQTVKLWSAAQTADMNLKPWNTQVTTFKGSTYIVFVDPSRRPKLVKIDPAGVAQEAFLEPSDYTAMSDAHHQFSIGVDERGYLHVTGDMHNYPEANTWHMPARLQSGKIMYWRSDHPEDITSFTWRGATVGECPYGYGNSYCSFFNDHEGRLFHTGRAWATMSYMGGKKDCAMMSRYDAATQTWEDIGGLPGVNKITMNSFFWEDNAEGGTSSYARIRAWGLADMDNRLHFSCNLLNNNDIPPGGHINSDCVYIRSDDGANSFTKMDGSAVPLPARVEAGSHQGDVLLSYKYLSTDGSLAVDQDLNPYVLIKNTSSQVTLVKYDPALGWTDLGWANCSTINGRERIYNDAMGLMTVPNYGSLHRFWSWDEATNKKISLPVTYVDVDRLYLQDSGNIQGLVNEGDLALYRTIITRPTPTIKVTGSAQSITNRTVTTSAINQTDWGHLAVGASYTKSYTIENTGTIPLKLHTVRVSNPQFKVTQQPAASVVAGGQTSFEIEYTATTNGVDQDVVSFGNSDPKSSRFMFAIQAEGVTVTTPLVSLSRGAITASETTGSPPPSQQFDVSNVGANTLNYTITKTDPNNMINITPTSGSSTGATDTTTHTVTFSSSLTPGTYQASITVTDTSAGSSKTIPVTVTVTAVPTGFTAYNDFLVDTGESLNNTTDQANGTVNLLNYDTGADTGISLTIATPASTGHWDNAAPTGGDALTLFGGKIGVGFLGHIYLGATDTITFTLDNLDPNKEYDVAFFGNRNDYGPSDSDARYAKLTITGADSFSNATTRVAAYSVETVNTTDDTGSISADNQSGAVIRFMKIKSGADGTVSFTDASNTKCYYNLMRLQETGQAAGIDLKKAFGVSTDAEIMKVLSDAIFTDAGDMKFKLPNKSSSYEYTVQYRTNLTAGVDWQDLSSATDIPGVDGSLGHDVNLKSVDTEGRLFIRVKVSD